MQSKKPRMGPPRHQSTTGLPSDRFEELLGRVCEIFDSRRIDLSRHSLGIEENLIIVLALLRNNASQMFLADMYGVSQPTLSRVYRRMLPILEQALSFTGISLEEAVRERHLLLVDGTYIPTGNRPPSGQEAANYSGKHRVQCLNIQVAADHRGSLIAVSDPVPGSRHDSKALELCGWSEILNMPEVQWIADSAYVSTTALTPIKKRPGIDRLEWEKNLNRDVASWRAPIEHAISHLKDWKMLSTGYRGRLAELAGIIRTATRLERYRLGW